MAKMMALDQIEAFVSIVRHGGFTRASALMHLSQPAISRRVQLLEAAVGARLFDRIRSGVAVNEAGRAFLPHAEAALASIRDGVGAVADIIGKPSGVVSLAIVGTLANTTLTAVLKRFRKFHPGVDLRIQTALSSEVSAAVLSGDATLGLRYEVDPRPYLESTIIGQERLVAVCSPGHRLAGASRVRPSQLAGERWLAFPMPTGARQELYASSIMGRLSACGISPSNVLSVDSLTAQKSMVEADLGLALLPHSSVWQELRAGRLIPLRVPSLKVSIPIVMIYRRQAFQTAASKSLIQALSTWSAPSMRR